MAGQASARFEDVIQKLRSTFQAQFEGECRIFRAPGRVNLIGEHTDYNDGFVLPAAIGLDTWVAAAPVDSGELVIYSAQQRQMVKFLASESAPQPRRDWTDYIRGVKAELQRIGIANRGVNMLVDGNVPIGAGLSSSAAIEVASALALVDAAQAELDSVAMARLCQRAENEFVGARCGIMDQFTCLHGQRGHAILLDCRSLEYRPLPLPARLKLVICNTMVKHSLAAGEYNARRAECEECVTELSRMRPGISALRDVSETELPAGMAKLPERLGRRLRHVISENARVLRAGEALRSGDMERFGELMYESHASLRDDFQVSCRELDVMVELAKALPGTIGARMTGGGFGGCTINVVEEEAVDEFVARVSRGYEQATGIKPEIYVTQANEGAARVA